ncbi:MAG: endonuclease III domain-containing protein [Syntrophomonadaceae bacterium]|jgi:endonuclease-3 related protein
MIKDNKLVMQIYRQLLTYFGPQGWWPGDSRLETIVGAILTQAVAWSNVEKSIQRLKQAQLLEINQLYAVEEDRLAELIRTTLYHRQKARKLKIMASFLIEHYDGNLDLMFNQPLSILRQELLSLWGIGEETADSILLYAGNYRIFVVDNYTRRIFSRLGLVSNRVTYKEMQSYLHSYTEPDVNIYNEYHALLVALGAGYCKKNRPHCLMCPIQLYCKYMVTAQENNDSEQNKIL